MSEQLYRWTNQSNGVWVNTESMRKELVADGVLVPVERCKHGMIDPHDYRGPFLWRFGNLAMRCKGAPELRALLRDFA